MKWLVPGPCCYPSEVSSIYCVRAYTEETFLYSDLNRAMSSDDTNTIQYFREYIRKCLPVFTLKCIIYFSGVVYRAVQISAEELQEYIVGTYVSFPSFVSTSKSLSMVAFRGTNTIFVIHTLPAAHQESLFMYTNADLHISKVSVMPSEEEVLFAPFSGFFVKSIEQTMLDGRSVTFINLEETDFSAAMILHLLHMQQDFDQGRYQSSYHVPGFIQLPKHTPKQYLS